MNFKKYSEMELAMLAAIANLTTEDVEDIEMEKGDIDSIAVEDCSNMESYLSKPSTIRHAQRRKATFKKKENRLCMAQNLGYDVSTERNSKKVADLLSANHSDRRYFRGHKKERKNWTIREELTLMKKEQMEQELEEQDNVLNNILCDFHIRCCDSYCADNVIAHAREVVEEATKELNKALAMKQELEREISDLEKKYFAYCDLFGRKG